MPTAVTEASFRALAPTAPIEAPPRVQVRAAATATVRVRIWDLPTRMFHWALVASLAALVATGYAGGAWIDWHARAGSLVLALLLFRVVWGVIGGRWSRFANFWPTPARVRAYLRGPATKEQDAGHSPLGALSVLAMLGLLLAQVATGLVSDDGGGYTGPLNAWVSSTAGQAATMLHKDYGQWMLAALVALHVAAIAFYRIARRRKLLQAMVDGDKLLEPTRAVPASRDDAVTRMRALCVFALCVLAVWMVTGF
jgi:cytochrome b